MIIILIVKILIALVGLGSAAFFILIGLPNRSPKYVRTGVIVFIVTVVIIAAITVTEFLLRK